MKSLLDKAVIVGFHLLQLTVLWFNFPNPLPIFFFKQACTNFRNRTSRSNDEDQISSHCADTVNLLTTQKIAYSSIRYFDLVHNRDTDYVCDFNRMLSLKVIIGSQYRLLDQIGYDFFPSSAFFFFFL